MNKVYLLIGGNLGDREKNLFNAREKISKLAGNIIQKSRIYQTAAWGIRDQPDFLNQVLLITTTFDPQQCLRKILDIEHESGRIRTEKNAARIIDIDILLFNDEIINEPGLSIPHPEIANRRFALAPLNELAPSYIHPQLHSTISELLLKCTDKLDVHIFNELYSGTDEI